MRHRDHTGVALFLDASQALGAGPFAALRAQGRAQLEAHGFPGTKDEDWKYTDARPLFRTPWSAPGPVGAVPALPAWLTEKPHLVFVNGELAPEHSSVSALPANVRVMNLASAGADQLGCVLDEPHGFDALNGALAADGAFVDVPAGVDVGEVLHLVHVHTGGGALAAVRHLIRLGRGSRLSVVEHYLGHGPGFTSALSEAVVGENAQLQHLRVQDEHHEAHHVGTLAATVHRDGQISSVVTTFGAVLSRTDVRVKLLDPGAACDLHGVYLLRGEQHADHHTHVEHIGAHTTSNELYKGILADRAQGVFTGRVVVPKGSQKINSRQANHNLLLDDRAVANSRPQLEISADDVKCAHGATVGRLDAESQFYLQQRGLDAASARQLLTQAFATEVLGQVHESARPALSARVLSWLGEAA